MPELLEVESFAALVRETLGARVVEVTADQKLCGAAPRCAVLGQVVVGVRRVGKWLCIDFEDLTVGFHAAMTGALHLDGRSALEHLAYSPTGFAPRFVRLSARLDDGRVLTITDPRRFARLVIEPDLSSLGPDALTLTGSELTAALASAPRAALKAVLLDQRCIAGLGNLLVDDACFRAALDPARPAGSLDRTERQRLGRAIRSTLAILGRRGGSHTGDLQPERHRAGRCPRCGAALRRSTIGGRTTYACPVEQR